MILDAFLFNLGKLLTKMVQDEVGMLLGIPGEIEKLEKTVSAIQCLLADAEKKKIESKAIERWLMELKDIIYDADDIMDLCQIKAQERLAPSDFPSSSKFGCGFLHMLSCFRNPVFAHKISTKIKQINLRLEGIAKQKVDLGLVESNIFLVPFDQVRKVDLFINRKTDPVIVQDNIVGEKIEEDTEMLVNWLIEERLGARGKVVGMAIVGMGGIGKTTLAKMIFNHLKIQEEFTLKIWVCVSKEVKGIELLKCIIREAGGGDHVAAQERSELVPLLKRLVQGKKFLLVLDDVWLESQVVWDGLLRDPMTGGAHGSRLLVTTRDERVTNSIKAAKLHRVQKLSDEDGWSLLMRQVQNEEDEDVQELKDIGLRLVKKCDGLPLAIKTVGGVLYTKSRTRNEWNAVLESNVWSWSIDGGPNDIHHAFYLSYEDLPSPLKQCFIICSLYPEDYMFSQSKLIYLWFTEGFLQDNGNLWKLGTEYYRELLLRNLLEPTDNRYDKAACKMHDLLWSFACYVGKDENLMLREGDSMTKREPFPKLRRLSIEGNKVNSKLFYKEKWLRTLVNDDIPENVLVDLCIAPSNLRILDLCGSNISTLPDAMSNLRHLRYLDVSNSKIRTVPVSIGNLRNLVFLSFSKCREMSGVPHTIINLKQLRFISIFGTKVKKIPAGLKNLENLIQLHGFEPDKNNLNGFSSLDELEALSQLVSVSLYGLEGIFKLSLVRKANLRSKNQLQMLILEYTSLSWEDQVLQMNEKKATAVEILNELSPPCSLEFLVINSYFGNCLPTWLNLGDALPNLRYLEIINCNCFEKLASLGQLPNLDLLRIEYAHSVMSVKAEFFGTNIRLRDSAAINCVITPFPKLKTLEFIEMSNWKEWQWNKEEPAMPKLKKLFITTCPQLKSLPEGLQHHATSLEFLQIRGANNLIAVENFPSIKEIRVLKNTNIKRISNLPSLSRIIIHDCPNLKTLENLDNSLQWMEFVDSKMDHLPEYIMRVKPQKLTIHCSKNQFHKITSRDEEHPEWYKFKHIPKVQIYSHDRSFYATYQKTPFCFTTNVS